MKQFAMVLIGAAIALGVGAPAYATTDDTRSPQAAARSRKVCAKAVKARRNFTTADVKVCRKANISFGYGCTTGPNIYTIVWKKTSEDVNLVFRKGRPPRLVLESYYLDVIGAICQPGHILLDTKP